MMALILEPLIVFQTITGAKNITVGGARRLWGAQESSQQSPVSSQKKSGLRKPRSAEIEMNKQRNARKADRASQ
jgi:hypothetical protein